jgi:hypothetical protein
MTRENNEILIPILWAHWPALRNYITEVRRTDLHNVTLLFGDAQLAWDMAIRGPTYYSFVSG